MSAELIQLHPTGIYDTQELRSALGETLWRIIGPQLPRLVKGRVLGEDVLTAVRALRDRHVDSRNATEAEECHAETRHGRNGGENNAEDDHSGPVQIHWERQ